MKSGTLICFSGVGLISTIVELATFGIPHRSLSHVGIVAHDHRDRLRLFESTLDAPDVCMVSGKREPGVRASAIERRIDRYIGKVWKYDLTRDLFPHESQRLTDWLLSMIGKGYDTGGAIRAGGYLLAKSKAKVIEPDYTRFFCSELTSAALNTIGVLPTCAANRWSPNSLIRRMKRLDLVSHPHRLK